MNLLPAGHLNSLFSALNRRLFVLWVLTVVALACGLITLVPASKLRQQVSPEIRMNSSVHFPPELAARIERDPDSQVEIASLGSEFSRGAIVATLMRDRLHLGSRNERQAAIDGRFAACRRYSNNDDAACDRIERHDIDNNWLLFDREGLSPIEKDQMAYVAAQINADDLINGEDNPVAVRDDLGKIAGNWQPDDEQSPAVMRRLLDYLGSKGLDTRLPNVERIAAPPDRARQALRASGLQQREGLIRTAFTFFAVALMLAMIAARRTLGARWLKLSSAELITLSLAEERILSGC